jgi:alkylated DNA nucleotide flippase Atl1
MSHVYSQNARDWMPKKTAIQKLNVDKQTHVVSPIPDGFPGAGSAHSMVVSTPLEVDGILRQVPQGSVTTLDEVRAYLARTYDTDIACPLSTAIFINIAAAAAEEMRAQGCVDVTPYWRTLKAGGKLNEKYPGGMEAQKAMLEAEGFTVTLHKGAYIVRDYQQALFRF